MFSSMMRTRLRTYTPAQRVEIVMAGMRQDRSIRDVCRTYDVPESTYYRWRQRWLAGGREALRMPEDR